jgi:hypothetical protein
MFKTCLYLTALILGTLLITGASVTPQETKDTLMRGVSEQWSVHYGDARREWNKHLDKAPWKPL